MAQLRLSGAYNFDRIFSVGVDYSKTWGWLFGSGYVSLTGISLYATVAW
jgi:hypothetical protein